MLKVMPIAKGLVVDADNNVLLLRRSETHPKLAGQYDMPGGQLDAGEEPGQALIREIKEETGLEVKFSQLQLQYAGNNLSDNTFRVRNWYTIRLTEVKPTVTISWEHQSYEWVPLRDLSGLLPQFNDFYLEALQHILKHKLLESA